MDRRNATCRVPDPNRRDIDPTDLRFELSSLPICGEIAQTLLVLLFACQGRFGSGRLL